MSTQATLTEKELAERWKLTTRTLQGWRSKQIGPRFVRLGERSIFYRLDDVLAYERANVVGNPVPPEGWDTVVKRAASAFDMLSKKANPRTAETIANIRDELRTLIE
jgi:hypothetical protein